MPKLSTSLNRYVVSLSNQSITQQLEQSNFPICHLTFDIHLNFELWHLFILISATFLIS